MLSRAKVLVVAMAAALLPLHASLAQTLAPGDERYSPTRLEWAALELQARYGEPTPQPVRPIVVTFLPRSDGVSVLCLIQYHAIYPEEALSVLKQAITRGFDLYRMERGWSWLRLQIQEQPL